MSFNFFNQSMMKPRIVPSEAEKHFLQMNTGFLDPKGEKRIQGKDAFAILNYSKLSRDKIMTIWNIANQKNSEYLSYEDMYVAFRLVSYAQNGIELSKQNVQANIKCSLPVFADSEDQNDRESSEARSPVSVPPSARSPSIVQKYFSQKQMDAFEDIWGEMNKNGYFVNGNDVKKRFQSAGQKQNLSRIWKLCCRTVKGSLSKGQCFAFFQILKFNNEGGNIPQSLTPQVISAIAQIDSVIKNNPSLLPKSVLMERQNSSSKFLKIQSKIKQNQQPLHQIKLQLSSIQAQQTKFNGALKQFSQYVSVCQRNTSLLSNQIQKIKAVQADSINRLNMDLSRLKQIIEKQNGMIYELTANLKNKTGDPMSLPEKRLLGSPIQHEAPSRFSNKSLQSQVSQRNDLYPYQLQTLKVLNAVRPFSAQQQTQWQMRIGAMNVRELQAFYTQLIKQYHQQQAQAQSQEHAHVQQEPMSIVVTQIQNTNPHDETYHMKDQSMFVKKNTEALDAIQAIFQNANLDDSAVDKHQNKQDFFD